MQKWNEIVNHNGGCTTQPPWQHDAKPYAKSGINYKHTWKCQKYQSTNHTSLTNKNGIATKMADWLKKRLGDWHLKRWWIDWLHSFLAALWAFVAICTHAGQTGNESKTSSKQQKTHAIGCAACQLAINKKGTSKSKLHAHCMQRQARRRLVAACKEQRGIP